MVLGRGSHVIADTAVTIGSDTYCGPHVYIPSTNHSYDDPDQPVGKQWPRMEPVVIGSGCWIGTGAVVLPGARLGRNVVVAAGVVVRGEVADHAVVAGAPAKVVRSWDPEKGWQPPLRTPAPVAIPAGVTPEQLHAVTRLDETAQQDQAQTRQPDPPPTGLTLRLVARANVLSSTFEGTYPTVTAMRLRERPSSRWRSPYRRPVRR